MNIVADVESFVRPTPEALSAMVETFGSLAQANSSHAVGGIFVLTPYSVSMCCHENTFYLFDSHSHFPHGALLASGHSSEAVEYLRHFFSTFYPGLAFNTDRPDLAGHLTMLKLI